MRKWISGVGIIACLAMGPLAPTVAYADSGQVVSGCGVPNGTYKVGQTMPLTQDTTGLACSNAVTTASITGFAPATTGTPITATTGGVTGTLPAGPVVIAFNRDTTNSAYCKLGASSTLNDINIPPNSWFAFSVGSATQLTCITAASTAVVNMIGGTGLPTGAGGGGGGGSSANASVSATGAAVPASGTYAGMNVGGNLTGMTGTANGLKVDPSAVTQPVSAASLPLPSGAATSANQTNASQKTQIVDGSGNVIAATSNALNIDCVTGCSAGGTTTPFAPTGNTSLNVNNTSARVALPSADTTLFLTNSGTKVAYFALGSGSVTATTSSTPIQPNQYLAINVTGGATNIAGITSGSDTSTLTVVTGTGTVVTGNSCTPLNPCSVAINGGSVTLSGTIPAILQAQSSHGILAGAVEGQTAPGVTPTENPEYGGCLAKTAVPTAVTDGQKVPLLCTKNGAQVVNVGGPSDFVVSGSASSASNTAVTLIAAQGAGVTLKIYGAECFRTDTATTAAYVTFNDTNTTGSGTTLPVPPATSGAAYSLLVPLQVAANTAFTFTPSAAITTIFCNAQGVKSN